jgi:activating signal cointegrator complex subunit 2
LFNYGAGWIIMDDEQFQYLSGIMMHSPKATIKEAPSTRTPITSNKAQMDEDTAVMESKISQIKDLFPDYGKGFLAACLEVYNQNPEEVIQRILEGTLHEDLQSLDTSLDTIPMPKSASTVNLKDKGKGKLEESALPNLKDKGKGKLEESALPNLKDKGKGKLEESALPIRKIESTSSTNSVSVIREQPVEGPSFSSSSLFGRYVRKPQVDLPDSNILDTRTEMDSVRAAALISSYEYDDEYDDSFDDLGLSVGDTGVEENELRGDKMSSNMGKSWGTETESSAQNAPSSKWGSKKNPQYYVKDGKNYSYKVAGSVAVANIMEASLLSQAQVESIHGLGRGGNFPLGAMKKLTESYKEQENQFDVSQAEGRGNGGNPRGKGRRGGGRPRESHGDQDKQSDASETEVRGDLGNPRGRGRRGGGRSNTYRKDRAMNKHFSGLTGF